MLKKFEDLTLQDDFMFYKVMQNADLCKKLIEMVLSSTIGKIIYISVQHNIKTYKQAKSVRFDVLVQTENGRLYDVEMQIRNERNIPKRMRFYQAAIDISFLDTGNSYSNLNDSFIIFICLFDVIGQKRPVYTFENICLEDKNISLQDGTKKIIINAEAFKKTENGELKEFLKYLKTGKAKTEFTRRIETMIQRIKNNERARQEYRLMSTFEMDARDKGFSEGVKQTAKMLKSMNLPITQIIQATGLSEAEIEKL
ncbi:MULTISPECIES: Rpn family recombination-promoting nuclease/putative transposase [unclassified Treponema]|uniref:Rpn family recombination-promoting nuclease/putative transposase n=1 Tax=unclassified Treponema TaxID=2638727 RepID=UPI0020A40273|nr:MULTISPECIES: Rpn family recombination-promoting nuclease/putative transposase [unclassified Treponema]UTC66637.1 Rpn family recombination-promoting nuclease/putative transposase [Treponema sp. OMZ 789]UTC69369.1 Rpn family recombination-promoting nuclease/putative transposase [Treponema sp. OMZ 790]UTC72084.1 Rpn family recombination-promoting nuclease/putative transposase [Treponema sp. OMZ 791]